MEIFAWVVAAAFALLAAFLGLRSGSGAHPEAISRLESDLRKPGALPDGPADDPPEVVRLREAIRSRVATSKDAEADPEARALRGLFRYLRQAVLIPLETAVDGGRSSLELENAADALRDLAFFAEESADEPARRENLQSVIQSVTREYALETGTPVRFSGPDSAVSVSLAAELFKDALFLLLANAGHFGKGETVEVVVETKGEAVEVRVRDRGPGFTEEALKRAFEPFWSSESDALGLGLHRSRELVEGQGGSMGVRNRDGGGAEAVVTLPHTR